jgi:hypothetical protein
MRPLIEILEDERILAQKLESVHRYIARTDDTETLDVLHGQKTRVERDLDRVRKELIAYIMELTK